MPKYKRWKPFSANLSIKCKKCWPRNPRYSGAIGNISVLLFYWPMSSLLHLNKRNTEGEVQEVVGSRIIHIMIMQLTHTPKNRLQNKTGKL